MPEAAARLVVKSPNHVFRLRAVQRAWPQARLVWTLRDPVETWHSNRKMWRAMTAMYALWEGRTEDLDRLLFKAMSEYAATLRWAADTLPPRTATYVDFARLTTDAAEALQALTRRLELGSWESGLPFVQRRLSEIAKQRPEAYEGAAPLPKHADALIAQIRELQRGLLGQAQR